MKEISKIFGYEKGVYLFVTSEMTPSPSFKQLYF